MQRLFLFLFRFRAFFFFIFLETICGWLIIQNNNYQSASFFNSSNQFVSNVILFSNNLYDFLTLNSKLKNENTRLIEENAQLKALIAKDKFIDNVYTAQLPGEDILKKYNFIPAKVINNSVKRINNYITIDKGSKSGITPGMAVISHQGIVGKIKACSEHFSTAISILHSDMYVSAQIKKNGIFGSLRWDGKNSLIANLLYIPRHVNLSWGDTIVTSSFNAIFPEGIMIGIIEDFNILEEKTFHDIRVKLSVNFQSLSYVYIAEKNILAAEKDSLEMTNYE
ncbi:MAG: rod shape-determining protein MreC [Cytophagales bacterium]|nr:rod shape-determining protein MreC [Cytophagales bacterium]